MSYRRVQKQKKATNYIMYGHSLRSAISCQRQGVNGTRTTDEGKFNKRAKRVRNYIEDEESFAREEQRVNTVRSKIEKKELEKKYYYTESPRGNKTIMSQYLANKITFEKNIYTRYKSLRRRHKPKKKKTNK